MVVQDAVLQHQVQRGQLLLGRGHQEEEAGGGVVWYCDAGPGATLSTQIFIYMQIVSYAFV